MNGESAIDVRGMTKRFGDRMVVDHVDLDVRAGEMVNFIPKIAARFWIDTRRRLIEQEQPRLVNKARSQREPLFPTAGEMTRELVFALGQSKLLQTFAHGLPPIFHVVHARDEIEILLNAQIFPKTESLGHVTGFAFDRFALVDDVVAKTRPSAFIRAQQSAKHPQERRFAAAVRAEKTENLAGTHVKIDMIDDHAIAEALRHSAHIDG